MNRLVQYKLKLDQKEKYINKEIALNGKI